MPADSWDLFDTLVAAPDPTRPAGDQDRHFPIAENIAKVQPDDIIVSDYYDREKAERIVREVCGLSNQLYVSEDGKSTGSIWSTIPVKPEHHTGDHPITDILSAQRAGISATQTTIASQTSAERAFSKEISAVLREARLSTWNPDVTLRGLQLHQIERNFPFLLKVAFELDKVAKNFTRLLLCSRDCYLLTLLMKTLFPQRDIRYFYNSRLTRYRPTARYRTYAKSEIQDKTLIVDMCGTGNSLKFFCEKFGGTPLLVVSSYKHVPSLVRGGIRETSNPAPHVTVTDAPPITYTTDPQIWTMVEAFSVCANLAAQEGLTEPGYTLQSALTRMQDSRIECLWVDHLADSKATYELLKSGPLPHEVLL